MTQTLYRNFFGKWFGKAKSIVISELGFTLVDVDQNTKQITVNQLIDFPYIEQSIFGNTLVIKTKTEVNRIWGISRYSAKIFENNAKIFENNAKITLNEEIANNITRQLDYFHQEAVNQFLRDSSVIQLHESVSPLIQSYINSKSRWQRFLSKQQLAKIDVISRLPPIKHAQSYRQYYENKMLAGQVAYFDRIESNPLTKDQRLAVIRSNDKNLILAAAGTGKTSVMVAKALYLITYHNVRAENILMLAYNNAAAKELKDRLESRKEAFGLRCQSPNIMTFHSLGLKIIKAGKGNISLSSFAEQPMQLERWFSTWFIAHISQSHQSMKRFIDLAYTPSNSFDFNTQADYQAHVRDNQYQTLQGEKVSNYQELLIANWLFLNSVKYKYQGQYVSKRRITTGVDYKPAFTILKADSNIYLDHFQVTRDGATRVGVDAKQYHQQMAATRALHQECATTLVETYHFDLIEDNLENRLAELMVQCNIDMVSKSPKEIMTVLNGSALLAENIKRYMKCLQAIRAEQFDNEQVENRLNNAQVCNVKQYSQLLAEIKQAYEIELKRQNAIDFDDMIRCAFDRLSTGDFKPQWTDILVDEFQDISSARMNLLNKLIDKGPRPRLTVVGDDWQSIYRFSGGKLALITQFEKYHGSHTLTTLEKTFRYNNSIAKTAGEFVMTNPEQYKKQIETHHQVEQSQVYLVTSDKNALDTEIAQLVSTIRVNDSTGSIAILARYRYLLDNAKTELNRTSTNNNVHYWTFHGSKGLEADYCLIIGLFRGKTGFPNENKENVVVEALLPLVDGFKNSEERRLLYVAITRAKHKVYLIADDKAPSVFIEELLSSSYDLRVTAKKRDTVANEKVKLCLKCGRLMTLKVGQYGNFWGCSGFTDKSDQCGHTEKAELTV